VQDHEAIKLAKKQLIQGECFRFRFTDMDDITFAQSSSAFPLCFAILIMALMGENPQERKGPW
jgi:hypothetical protein